MKKRNALPRRAMTALLALALCAAAGLTGWRLLAPEHPTPQPGAEETANGGMPMRADRMPNADAYYRVWDLPFADAQGKPMDADAFRGRPLVLLYWASWCPDCALVMDRVEPLAQAAEAAGARFELAVRTGVRGETGQTAMDALRERGIARGTLLDADGAIYGPLGLRWVPSLLFFAPSGALMLVRTGDLRPDTVRAGVAYAVSGGRAETWDFVARALLDGQGGIAASYMLEPNGAPRPKDEQLSETTGLAMLYALRQGDRALFDRLYAFVQPYVARGWVPWRWVEGRQADVSATLDDLRILEALMGAERRWGAYGQDVDRFAAGLARNAAPDGKLRDHTGQGQASGTLTLCYADIVTLDALALRLPDAWKAAADSARETVLKGRLGDAFPLFAVRYDHSAGAYVDGDFLQMNEAMVTVYHLARAGLLPLSTQEALRDWVRKGPIYAAYDGAGKLVPGYGYESTATYALLVLTGCALDDWDMARWALWRMEQRRVVDAGSPANGSYSVIGEVSYTFDTMTALLAWDALEATGFMPH